MNLYLQYEYINLIKKNFKNWIPLVWKIKITKPKKIRIVTKGDDIYYLWYNQVLLLLKLLKKKYSSTLSLNYIKEDKIPYNNQLISLHGWIGENNVNNGNIFDVFINEEYKFLNVKDKIVIDIGASIGDSSIYFALNGAKKVIGLEPYPYPFSFAKRNVEENNLNDKIEILNAGYGEEGEIIVDVDKITNDAMNLVPSKSGKKIKIYSLKSIVDEFRIDKAVLKMDCEGCEYNLLQEKEEILRKFERIQIEYHYGYEKIKYKLESCGFNTRTTKPRRVYNKYVTNPKMYVGYIYAEKK